jgi:recombination protein RecA
VSVPPRPPTATDLGARVAGEVNAFYRKEDKLDRDVLQPARGFAVRFLPTGSLALDRALGGGFAYGRTVELYGPLSTLKTYFAYQTIARGQEAGMPAIMVDLEGTFDPARAERLGVDLDALRLTDPELSHNAQLEVIETAMRQGPHVVVVDSVAAIVARAEAEARMGADQVGRQAALMSTAMRRLTAVNRSSVLLFCNQLRENVGVTFGARTKPSGGRALGFYATHRIAWARIETIKGPHDVWRNGKRETKQWPVAHLIQATVEKNKVGRPGLEVVFRFDLAAGTIDRADELQNLGLELGVIQPDGAQHFVLPSATGEVVRVRYASGLREALEGEHGEAVAMAVATLLRA